MAAIHPATCGGCCTRLLDFGVRLGGTAVLEHIQLHVHCGELSALIGPNGAGKTTLFRALLGEVPHTGQVRFVHAGNEQRFESPRIGYVPQLLEFDRTAPVSVRDLFAAATTRRPLWAGVDRRCRQAALDALALVGAQDLFARNLGRLSGGELQRVLLALALNPQPDLLLLDEPVSGVDQGGMELFYRMVSQLRRQLDLSILLITHDLAAVARVADRMIFLNRRVLADGPPAAVLASPLIREVFGLEFSARAPDFVQRLPARVECPPAAAAPPAEAAP